MNEPKIPAFLASSSEKKTTSQPLVVSQFMHFGLETCSPDTSVRDAIRVLSQKNTGSILIEDDGHICGIWTRTDLLKLDVSNQPVFDGPISEVMSSPVCQIHQDELISSATYFSTKNNCTIYWLSIMTNIQLASCLKPIWSMPKPASPF